MSSDWRFASIRGNLKWTSPAFPTGGVELFSELSPTLIVGHQEEGDVLPVDYIKLSTVRSATLTATSPETAGIELVREGGSTVLLVAPTAANASEWHKMINIAISDGKAPPAKSAAPVAAGGIAAPPPPAAAPAERNSFNPVAALTPPLMSASSVPALQLRHATPPTEEAPAAASFQRSAASPALQHQPAVAGGSLKIGPSPQPQPASNAVQQPAAVASSSCAFDSSGAHDFRPLRSITAGSGAQTTTVATHMDLLQQAAGAMPAPSSGAAWATNPRPAAGSGPQLGGAWAPSATAVNLTSQLSDVHRRPEPSAVSGGGMSRPLPDNFSSAAAADGTAAAAGTSSGMPFGGTNFARKRSGMLVDVPPNPQFNRNIAPNVSAIWKEWIGPDGVLYVSHEPSGTIQRRIGDTNDFETLLEGTEDISSSDMALRPYSGTETAVDLNTQTIKNLGRYGSNSGGASASSLGTIASPNVYRQDNVTTPRGQYSPTRRTALQSLVPAPRQSQSAYTGRRVHQLTLGPAGEEAPTASVIEHQIQILSATGLRWDPTTGTTVAPDGTARGDIGPSTLEKQWEHVRRILLQGRIFKKHALRTTQSSFRFVFLTADNAYVVCVPTSQVPVNFSQDPMSFGSVTDTVQYYGPESRAIALNTITHVSLGMDEAFVRQRKGLVPENVFCIVSRTHAFILECNTSEEAKYFSDAWTFFLYHSKPLNPAKNKPPAVKNPVTFGTRAGIAF